MSAAADKLARKMPESVCCCGHAAGWHFKSSARCTYPGCACRTHNYSPELSRPSPLYREVGSR